MRIARMRMAIMLVIVFVGPLRAQVTSAATDRTVLKAMSRRAAEADAYRKLAECIKGLRINSQTYVKDFVAESNVIQSSLDDFLKRVRLGQPTWAQDLSCEVPAEVTVTQVVETLKDIHSRHYKGDHVKGHDLEEMIQTRHNQIIKVMGVGAPRSDLPPDLPEGVESALTPAPHPLPSPATPTLWQQIPAHERLMAIQAAERDCQQRLLERVEGLRVTSDTLVRDFVTESDVIQTAASGLLRGYQRKQVYLHDDEPIVEVTGSVPVESVIAMIKEVHSRSIQGSRIRTTDIDEMTKAIKHQTFEATGMGVPRLPALKRFVAIAAYQPAAPDWATGILRSEGHGVPPADKLGTAQGRLSAARAAELDARRNLAEKILGLPLNANTRVREFVGQHDEIRAQVDAFMVGASVDTTEFDGDAATVTVGLPGIHVWSVFRERMK